MLRAAMTWLAALVLAAGIAFAPAKVQAGEHFGGAWHDGWSDGSRWNLYGGRFVASDTHTYLHEYSAFNPGCVWLRRLVPTPTPYGPRWQLVPVCF
jgi:hypothetical protein